MLKEITHVHQMKGDTLHSRIKYSTTSTIPHSAAKCKAVRPDELERSIIVLLCINLKSKY